MKKTFTINISGTVFHIEEDAYEVLQKYLINLKGHFGSEEEGKEILADIEARIAEIFTEKATDERKVITLHWVEEVIETMGTPEDFVEEESDDDEVFTSTSYRKRRLYRDPEHRVAGGVCGGLGAYFNMDPVILRIIFVVLTIITSGAAILAYIVLWIAVPKAITTAQRLEMRGQEATVKNIEKSIREEVKEVQESYKKFRQSDTYARGKKKMEGAGSVAYHILKLLLKIAVVLVGVVLIIGGIIGLLGLISTIIIGQSIIQGMPLAWGPDIYFPDVLEYLVDEGTVRLGVILIGFLAGIPMLAMLYIGSKLVFRYKSNNTVVGLGLTGVWLIALLALFIVSTSQLRNFRNESSVVESNALPCDTCQILYLQVAQDTLKGYAAQGWDLNQLKVMHIKGEKLMVGSPRLDIEKSGGDDFVVMLRKISRGTSRETARDYASDVEYSFRLQDSVLIFDPYFFLKDEAKWRDQRLFITLKVPEGKLIYMDEQMVDIIYDVENVTNTWDRDMVGKYWEMKPDGLTMRETETAEE
jgi:phage shock protein PspC (stress-responsive transcriptional regulator)